MKRLMTTWMMSLLMVLTFPAMAAMSTSKMRQHSRFLTDRMAYELNLSSSQYDDVYEVNYDFLSRTRYLIDDVTAGYTSAIDEYYDYLDVRNDDLRWILTSSQYRRFLEKEYFYRPIYTTTSGSWGFRIYQIYTDVTHFYFGKPSHYSSYKGGHYRSNFNNVSFYKTNHTNRYKNNDVYQGDFAQGKTMKKEQKRVNNNNPNSSSANGGNTNVSRPSNSNNGNSSHGNGGNKENGQVNNGGNSNTTVNNPSKDKSTTTNRSSRNSTRNKNTDKSTTTTTSNSSNRSNSSTKSNNSGSRSNTSGTRSNNSGKSNNTTTRTNNSGRSRTR